MEVGTQSHAPGSEPVSIVEGAGWVSGPFRAGADRLALQTFGSHGESSSS